MQTLAKRLPKHWRVEGHNTSKFSVCMDNELYYKHKTVVLINSNSAEPEDYARLYQAIDANNWRGTRLRIIGNVKTEDVENHAVITVSVSSSTCETLVYDAMIDRSISATSDWQLMEIIVDVPENARWIDYGPALWGNGKMWISNLNIETVSKAVACTDLHGGTALIPAHYSNLDFVAGLPDNCITTYFKVAPGWSYPPKSDYLYSVMESAYKGAPAAVIEWITAATHGEDKPEAIGYFKQHFSALPYRGKKVRFSAYLKTEEVKEWSGLVLMVNGALFSRLELSKDPNGISGSQDWTFCSAVLNVPEIAYSFSIWLQIQGSGKVSFAKVNFETVNSETPTTDGGNQPLNLDFQE